MRRCGRLTALAAGLMMGIGLGSVGCDVAGEAFWAGTNQALQDFLGGGTGQTGGGAGSIVETAILLVNLSEEQFTGTAVIEGGSVPGTFSVLLNPGEYTALAEECVDSVRVTGSTPIGGGFDVTLSVAQSGYECGQGVVLTIAATGDPVLQRFASPQEITIGGSSGG